VGGLVLRRGSEGGGKKRGAEKAGPENLPRSLFRRAKRANRSVFGMNPNLQDSVTLSFSGQITLDRGTLVAMLREAIPPTSMFVEEKPVAATPPAAKKPARLAYSTKETAELLNCSTATVYRLIQRGLLRSSLASRTKMIAHSEIERFLAETSKSLW